MEIKGTAVIGTLNYIKNNYSSRYTEWFTALPAESQKIYDDIIMTGNWYPLKEAILDPTATAGKLFFDGNIEKAAYEMGKESAFQALRGIYKIFVKIASVDFVLKRSKSVFSTYYSGGVIDIISRTPQKVDFAITGFKKGEELVFHRIAGWIDGIFSVVGSVPESVDIDIVEEDDEMLVGKIIAKL
jgi:hypothetical protein